MVGRVSLLGKLSLAYRDPSFGGSLAGLEASSQPKFCSGRLNFAGYSDDAPFLERPLRLGCAREELKKERFVS